jgi:hypothetical protein
MDEQTADLLFKIIDLILAIIGIVLGASSLVIIHNRNKQNSSIKNGSNNNVDLSNSGNSSTDSSTKNLSLDVKNCPSSTNVSVLGTTLVLGQSISDEQLDHLLDKVTQNGKAQVFNIVKQGISMVPKGSEKSINAEWFNHFFSGAQDVTEKDLQLLWSKLLSGEIQKPGSYSYRTLSVLSEMTTEEALIAAECFRRVLDGDFIVREPFFESGEGLHKIMVLSESGIVNNQPFLKETKNLGAGEAVAFQKSPYLLLFKNQSAQQLELKFSVIALTSVGQELYSLIRKSGNLEDLRSSFKTICDANKKNGLEAHIYKILSSDGPDINYEERPLE